MLKLYFMIMMLNSVTLTLLNSPMMMGLALLIQTIVGSLFMRLLVNSSWLPLTMFLIMVSGLLIIFTYVSSINSNNKFKVYSWKKLIYSIPALIFIYSLNPNLNMSDNYQLKDLFNLEYMKLYTSINIPPSLFMFIYLLLILVIMINLMSKTKGPLRKKY